MAMARASASFASGCATGLLRPRIVSQYSSPGDRALVDAPFALSHTWGLTMRFAIPALAFLGVGVLALAAAADPAPTTQPERAATPAAPVTDSASPATSAATGVPAPPAASSPAASPPAAPKAAAPTLSAAEQRLISQGYRPQSRNGEKIYCRREPALGSRINAGQHCGTVSQLTTATQDGKDYLDQTNRTQTIHDPMGTVGPH